MTAEEQADFETLLRYLKTLADQTRLRLVGLLAAEKRSVEELAALLDLKPSTVSWHLGKLKEIELVEMRAEGNTHIYRLNGKGLGKINRLLGTPERVALLAEDVEGDAWERKVLNDYFVNGRLKEIPSYIKKRRVILRYLGEQFEWGRLYSEKEVNELLGRFHPDFATLRRDLIGFRQMQREHGLYWRGHLLDDAALGGLAERFERGRRYHKAEVDGVLTEAAPDYAADLLRRELLGVRLLECSGDFYWRTDATAQERDERERDERE